MYFNKNKIQGVPHEKLKRNVVIFEKESCHVDKAKMCLRTGRDHEFGMKRTIGVTILYEGFKLSITI